MFSPLTLPVHHNEAKRVWEIITTGRKGFLDDSRPYHETYQPVPHSHQSHALYTMSFPLKVDIFYKRISIVFEFVVYCQQYPASSHFPKVYPSNPHMETKQLHVHARKVSHLASTRIITLFFTNPIKPVLSPRSFTVCDLEYHSMRWNKKILRPPSPLKYIYLFRYWIKKISQCTKISFQTKCCLHHDDRSFPSSIHHTYTLTLFQNVLTCPAR